MYSALKPMSRTQRFSISAVTRPHPIHIVSPTDFKVDAGNEISPEQVWLDPRFSLYCVDPENDRVLFVETNDPESVDRAAFYYQAQVQYATGLVSMSTSEFHAIAARTAEPPKGLIFVHSVGRCGSTLLSKVLAGIPSLHSLSEPDDLTQMVTLRGKESCSDEWLRKMIISSVRWRCKPRIGGPFEAVAIKTRSEVLVLGDLIGECFPYGKHIYLYRNAVSWMATMFRNFSPDREIYDDELNQKMEESWARMLPLVRELRRQEKPMNPVQIRILAWITCMESYLGLRGMGVPMIAVRFEDLTTHPIPILKQVLEFCESYDVDWTVVHEVLGRDSQAGTMYDREERQKQNRVMTEDLILDLKNMVEARPLLGSPSVILPGTITV